MARAECDFEFRPEGVGIDFDKIERHVQARSSKLLKTSESISTPELAVYFCCNFQSPAQQQPSGHRRYDESSQANETECFDHTQLTSFDRRYRFRTHDRRAQRQRVYAAPAKRFICDRAVPLQAARQAMVHLKDHITRTRPSRVQEQPARKGGREQLGRDLEACLKMGFRMTSARFRSRGTLRPCAWRESKRCGSSKAKTYITSFERSRNWKESAYACSLQCSPTK